LSNTLTEHASQRAIVCRVRFRIYVSVKTEELDVGAGGNPRFARRDVDLFFDSLDARQVWQEQPSVKPAFVFDDHAINFWIKIVETARLGRGKNIDRIFETRKFISADRRKSWIMRGGADRVHYDFVGKRVLDRLYCADAAAQIAVARCDGSEASSWDVEV